MSFRTDSNRIFGLDVVRAFAIILVVSDHGGFILNDTIIERFPYFRMIDGVEIFFVLSGFLIGGLLLKKLNNPNGFVLNDLLTFWKRRWFRTLPNYYLILLLNLLVVKFGLIHENINRFNLGFLTFTQNFRNPFYGFFWESWSLSVEEWFYIITPILIFGLHKILPRKSAFLGSALIMIIFPLVYRFSIYNPNIEKFWWDVMYRKTVLCRLDSIGYGLLSAWFFRYYPGIWSKIKFPALLLGIILTVFILNFDAPVGSRYKQITFFSLVSFTVMLFMPFAESFKKAKGFLPVSIEFISKISYSMYLINLALVAEVIRDNFPPSGGVDGILKYLLYWIIVISGSALLYKYYEKPMMDLRDKNLNIPFLVKRNRHYK